MRSRQPSCSISIVLTWALLVLTCAPAAAEGISAGSQSRPALDFEATNLDGTAFHALALEGNIVLLDFWAVWCAPCIEAFPKLKKLNSDFRRSGLKIIGIAVYSGTAEDVSKVVAEHDLDYPVVVGDEDLVFRFGVIGYPTYFLVSPEGAIYKQYVGDTPEFYDTVKADIAALRGTGGSGKEGP